MKKRIVPLILVLALVLSLSAYASVQSINVTPTLSISGTTATCSVSIMEMGADIDVTLELWCGDDPVDSWSDSDTSLVNLSGKCKVSRGNTYTLIASGTIDGEPFESKPVTKTCR